MSSVIWYNLGGVDFLSVIKNGLVIDIACSISGYPLTRRSRSFACTGTGQARAPGQGLVTCALACPWARPCPRPTKVRVKDLALYTHWPQHTKEFWDLLNET